jgi:hypothetical protein
VPNLLKFQPRTRACYGWNAVSGAHFGGKFLTIQYTCPEMTGRYRVPLDLAYQLGQYANRSTVRLLPLVVPHS